MVVLAVTWMAKIGRESETVAIFEKLSAESRKEPGCADVSGAQAQDRSAAVLHLRTIQRRCRAGSAPRRRRISCRWRKKICPRLPTGRKGICSSRSGEAVASGRWCIDRLRRTTHNLSLLVDHEHAAAGVTFLRHFHKSDDDTFAACAGFFDHGVGDALGEFALLIGGAAGSMVIWMRGIGSLSFQVSGKASATSRESRSTVH